MRRLLALLATAIVVSPGSAVASTGALRTLTRTLGKEIRAAGPSSGADVVDLDTGRTLYAYKGNIGRLPASVEKLYTSSTALIRFGPNARLQTRVLGVGALDSTGTWHGTLYLRGGGDPTFGDQGFDRYHYGTGATMQQLVGSLVKQTGIKAIQGSIVGDESYLDSRRGTIYSGYAPSGDIEGLLSGLAYDRGFTSSSEVAFQTRPALFAAQRFEAALRADHVKVPNSTAVRTGATPTDAVSLAAVQSPPMSELLKLMNTPSDNFFAEMLIKDIGARFGGAGTTAAGAAVVRAQMAKSFRIHPRLDDGSGLSYHDSTSPAQVVALLTAMSTNVTLWNSLAIAGETGTLVHEMRGTIAQGNCRGKTGTLLAVSNLVGYCTARDGHTLAFAFLMNSINPGYAHPIQDQMAITLARYRG